MADSRDWCSCPGQEVALGQLQPPRPVQVLLASHEWLSRLQREPRGGL